MTHPRQRTVTSTLEAAVQDIPPPFGRSEAADEAMRLHDQVISLVCGNLRNGRDGFFGIGQFVGKGDE